MRRFKGALKKVDNYRWLIPKSYMPGMRVPGLIFADEKLLENIRCDNAPEQLANAAHLPGVVRYAMAMPDIHWGYGLPIGGVLATDIDKGGVISPGGIGYDINCGVRMLRTHLSFQDVRGRMKKLLEVLYGTVPAGVGSEGSIQIDPLRDEGPFVEGARWAVKKGHGREEDLEFCEERGSLGGAKVADVSDRALKRSERQAGTLGSGNHFLEVQVVEKVYDTRKADAFGVREGQITVMIHTGSRGLGHQICTDYARRMQQAMSGYDIRMPDKQLACVPVESPDGRAYLSAMRCGANYAWANRQILSHLVRKAFGKVFGNEVPQGIELIYDVAHNIAKIEEYVIDGAARRLCVHRKGATRAFPPDNPELPERYRKEGQPVIIPGDMGRCSFLLAGRAEAEESFYSTCHGAGRLMSRRAAKEDARGRDIQRELAEQGILVLSAGRGTLAEEAPAAYKDVVSVVNIVEKAGLSSKVARLRPLGVIKG